MLFLCVCVCACMRACGWAGVQVHVCLCVHDVILLFTINTSGRVNVAKLFVVFFYFHCVLLAVPSPSCFLLSSHSLWSIGRALDVRLRGAGFESCAAVLKP